MANFNICLVSTFFEHCRNLVFVESSETESIQISRQPSITFLDKEGDYCLIR